MASLWDWGGTKVPLLLRGVPRHTDFTLTQFGEAPMSLALTLRQLLWTQPCAYLSTRHHRAAVLLAASFAAASLVMAPNVLASEQAQLNYQPLTEFANPGELTASYFAPVQPKALLVLLHGCGQQAQTLAEQSGFAGQAQAHHVALLLPQQQPGNNATLCFNWFSQADQVRDQGEVGSLMAMITTLQQQLGVERVYLAGLSAGGAMASNLLLQYPERFQAGAVFAGIPFPCADELVKAISCMKSGASANSLQLPAALTAAKHWPNLLVMTGSDDSVVNPKNALQMAEQWAGLIGASSSLSFSVAADVKGQRWQQGAQQVELLTIAGMGHGIAVNSDVANGGSPAPYVLAAPLSAAQYVMTNWFGSAVAPSIAK